MTALLGELSLICLLARSGGCCRSSSSLSCSAVCDPAQGSAVAPLSTRSLRNARSRNFRLLRRQRGRAVEDGRIAARAQGLQTAFSRLACFQTGVSYAQIPSRCPCLRSGSIFFYSCCRLARRRRGSLEVPEAASVAELSGAFLGEQTLRGIGRLECGLLQLR